MVHNLRSAYRRNPVAKAFVGSNPTPRTNDVIQCSSQQAILNHGFYLKKEGYRESTIISRVKSLRGLSRKADLYNPEAVKVATSKLSVTARK